MSEEIKRHRKVLLYVGEFYLKNIVDEDEILKTHVKEALTFFITFADNYPTEKALVKEINPYNSEIVHYSKDDIKKLAKVLTKLFNRKGK